MLNVLNVEPWNYSIEAKRILQKFSTVDEIPFSRNELLENIKNYDVLIVRLGYLIDEEVITRATSLQTIVTATTGLDHIDLKAASDRGITVLSLKGETGLLDTITATAEHTFALLLSLVRRIPQAFESVKCGNWCRDNFWGSELQGKILGIIGFGRLGKMVAEYGKAFKMEIIATDPDTQIKEQGIKQLDLADLLMQADVATIHVPLSDETHHLISSEEIQLFKEGSWLINTSRGDVLDELALLRALGEGRLAGAALDVLSNEFSIEPDWVKGNPLVEYAKNHDNLLITPHIGGATCESMRKTEIFMAEKLFKIFGSKS